jgi:alanine dehydrogenase
MKIGIVGFSTKENEKRYPLHPAHIRQLSKDHLKSLYFEENYPGISKENKTLNFLTRKQLFRECDLIILPKATQGDFTLLRKNQILWGWVHCVQGIDITQVAINKKLTMIAWENMSAWNKGSKSGLTFSRNNEVAGYASVIHALSLNGITSGCYGERKKIAVIGYGSTGKGAVNALLGLGCSDLTVFSKRSRFELQDAFNNVKYETYNLTSDGVEMNGVPSQETLKEYDIIVNCVLQDPSKPIIFLTNADASTMKDGCIIIDVSCDKSMGFEFGSPTTFKKPQFRIGNLTYYGVDHSPSFFWNAASYEISGALMPHLLYILDNGSYLGNETIEKAVVIENGNIIDERIIDFQNRESISPYRIIKKGLFSRINLKGTNKLADPLKGIVIE